MSTTEDRPEQISIGAKVSSRMWQTIVGLALASGGAIGGVALTGAKAPAPIERPDPAPELRASIAAVDNAQKATAAAVDRDRAIVAKALETIALAQSKQADTLKQVGESIARIEGQLTPVVARRR